MGFNIEKIEKDFNTSEMYATITISNTDIRIIKSAIELYEGDKDDTKYQDKLQAVRDRIHQTWGKLNPG